MLTLPDILSAILHRLHALLSTLLLFIVSLGPIPRHVGFVMDGNRRYARGRGRQVAQGHSDGFDSLKRVSCQFPTPGAPYWASQRSIGAMAQGTSSEPFCPCRVLIIV